MHALTLRNRLVFIAVASSLCIAASAVNARVVKITVDSTTPVSNGALFGTVGAYELLRGTAIGEIDPTTRVNAAITHRQTAVRRELIWCKRCERPP